MACIRACVGVRSLFSFYPSLNHMRIKLLLFWMLALTFLCVPKSMNLSQMTWARRIFACFCPKIRTNTLQPPNKSEFVQMCFAVAETTWASDHWFYTNLCRLRSRFLLKFCLCFGACRSLFLLIIYVCVNRSFIELRMWRISIAFCGLFRCLRCTLCMSIVIILTINNVTSAK